MMPLVEEDLDIGFTRTSAGEEVNSLVKKPHAGKSPMKKLPAQMSVVQDSIVTGILTQVVSSDAHLKGTKVPLVTECSAEEGLSLHQSIISYHLFSEILC